MKQNSGLMKRELNTIKRTTPGTKKKQFEAKRTPPTSAYVWPSNTTVNSKLKPLYESTVCSDRRLLPPMNCKYAAVRGSGCVAATSCISNLHGMPHSIRYHPYYCKKFVPPPNCNSVLQKNMDPKVSYRDTLIKVQGKLIINRDHQIQQLIGKLQRNEIAYEQMLKANKALALLNKQLLAKLKELEETNK